MQESVASLFLDFSDRKLITMNDNLASCLARLDDTQVWQKQCDHENSIANLILHLCGNMRQWILHGIRGDADVRTRDAEFEAAHTMSREELLAMFTATTAECRATIATVSAERLAEIIHPQDRTVSVLEAIAQVTGHVQQHVGQIILLTKQMAATDLDLTMPRKR
jgi:uncharacterized damage-inducible protein DinB